MTKADWRETLVMNVSETGLASPPRDVLVRPAAAVRRPRRAARRVGFCYVLWRWPRRAVLLLLLYLANLAFAWTYNVGDAYIFFLPSHYVVALFAGAGVAAVVALASRMSNRTMAAAASALLCWSIRSGADTTRFPPSIAAGTTGRSSCSMSSRSAAPGSPSGADRIGVDTNWQVQNAFEYFMRERQARHPVVHDRGARMAEEADPSRDHVELSSTPTREIGRDIVHRDCTTGSQFAGSPWQHR